MSKLVETMKMFNKVEFHLAKNETKLKRFYEIKNNFISKHFWEIVDSNFVIEYWTDGQNSDTRYWDKIYIYPEAEYRSDSVALSPRFLDSVCEEDDEEMESFYEGMGFHFTILPPQLKVWQLEVLLDNITVYREAYGEISYEEYVGYIDEACLFIKPLTMISEHLNGEVYHDYHRGCDVDFNSVKHKLLA